MHRLGKNLGLYCNELKHAMFFRELVSWVIAAYGDDDGDDNENHDDDEDDNGDVDHDYDDNNEEDIRHLLINKPTYKHLVINFN